MPVVTVYIYGLFCPLAFEFRYVGKTISPERRLEQHCVRSRKRVSVSKFAAWLEALRALKLKPALHVLEITDAETWSDAERWHIARLLAQGCPLLNATIGGNGFCSLTYEDELTRRKNASKAHRKRLADPKILDEVQKRLIVSITPDVMARRAGTLKRTLADPERRIAISIKSAEVGARPEVKTARSDALVRRWADPAARKKNTIAMELKWRDPDYVARVAAGQKAASAKMSESAKLRASTPERRAELSKQARDAAARRRERKAMVAQALLE